VQKESHATNVIAKNTAFHSAFGLDGAEVHHWHIGFLTVHLVKVPRCLPTYIKKINYQISLFTRVYSGTLPFWGSTIKICVDKVVREIKFNALVDGVTLAIELSHVVHLVGLTNTSCY
jgi:hypothetical protein